MMFIQNTRYEIKTPNGFEHFDGIQKVERGVRVEMIVDGEQVKCSPSHTFYINGVPTHALDVKEGDILDGTVNGVVSWVDVVEEDSQFYDIVNSGKDHLYYGDGLLSHNCKFMGSAGTLIASAVLQAIPFRNPIKELDDMKIYLHPNQIPDSEYYSKIDDVGGEDEEEDVSDVQYSKENRVYVATVDSAHGVGGDSSVTTVFDVTEIPYRVAAIYKSNLISPMLYPTTIHNICKHYNNCSVLIEVNDVGYQVSTILFNELEYEHVLLVDASGGAQKIGGGFGSNVQLGIKTNKQTKAIGCSNLKTLIENDRLIINDYGILQELGTFIAKGQSYEADDGCHDDTVATLFLFSWLTTQEYFKDLISQDIRRNILARDQLEESLTPFGIINDGSDNDWFVDDDGQMWSSSSRMEEFYQ